MAFNTAPGGATFGEDPALYDSARPAYPPELFAWLQGVCGLGPDSACFEIGAGTGHASLPVLALPVRSLLAIEPDPALADLLAMKAGDALALEILVSTFEEAELAPAGFDFAFAATSFHWLKRMKAFAQVLAALKPGGWFAMWWAVYHDPASPDAFDRASDHLFEGFEQKHGEKPRIAFGLDIASRLGEMRAAGFTDTQHRVFPRDVDYTPESLAALMGTFSRVRMTPPENRKLLLEGVERLAREDFGGRVTRTIRTSVFVGCKPA
jgi:SAM-dependent methyltransferase